MTHLYAQSTGLWNDPDATSAQGYSGHGEGLNNPDMQTIHNIGPIPRGEWRIGQAMNHPRLGPLAMPLAFVRSEDGDILVPGARFGFFIHGDNQSMNHTASDGCIILPRDVRQKIQDSADRVLLVVG